MQRVRGVNKPTESQAITTPSRSESNGQDALDGQDAPQAAKKKRLFGARKRTDCLNCGAERMGRFCQNCGQKYLDAPITYWSMGKAFVDRVFDLDQGLLYTIRRLAVDPGEVSLEYIKGRQRPYAHPLAYMVIATAVFLGLFGLTEDVVRIVTEGMLTPYFDQTDEVYEVIVDQVMKPYATVIFILSCLPIAYVLRRLFSSTADYTTAETLVMVLYCTAQATLYTGICQLVVLAVPNATGVTLAQISSLLVFPVIGHGAYGFYRRSAGDALLGFVGSIAGYVVTMVGFVIVGAGVGVLFAIAHSAG